MPGQGTQRDDDDTSSGSVVGASRGGATEEDLRAEIARLHAIVKKLGGDADDAAATGSNCGSGGRQTGVKEWHFHVYFDLDSPEQISSARALRLGLVDAVKMREFIVVCPGVGRHVLPELSAESEARVPSFNEQPRGPHPQGSFEVWCPMEHLGSVLAWLTVRRGPCSILLHPLGAEGSTGGDLDDHTIHAMFLGKNYEIKTDMLTNDSSDSRQYPELSLGYSSGN